MSLSKLSSVGSGTEVFEEQEALSDTESETEIESDASGEGRGDK
jgi:hypothetical protein